MRDAKKEEMSHAPGRLLPALIDTKDFIISLYPEGSSSVCETDFYKMF